MTNDLKRVIRTLMAATGCRSWIVPTYQWAENEIIVESETDDQ